MTNLKDKLSASLRQAKEGGQAPAKPVAKAIKKTQPNASPALAVTDTVTELKSQQRPKPTPKAQPITSSGFGFPERVWPD
jgi:hypothetical protein